MRRGNPRPPLPRPAPSRGPGAAHPSIGSSCSRLYQKVARLVRLQTLLGFRTNRYQEMQKGRWWEAKTESQDINRIYRVGDRYLTASRYGLKTYPVKTPKRTLQKLRFPGNFADCEIGRPKR